MSGWLGLAFGGGAIAFGSGALAVCLGYYIGAHHQRRKDHPMTTATPEPSDVDPEDFPVHEGDPEPAIDTDQDDATDDQDDAAGRHRESDQGVAD